MIILGDSKNKTHLFQFRLHGDYSISFLNKIVLNHSYNKILAKKGNEIFLGLNFLYHPMDEPYQLALGKINLLTNAEISKNLSETIDSKALLSVTTENISINNENIFVSHLSQYKIDIYNHNFERVDSIYRLDLLDVPYLKDKKIDYSFSKQEIAEKIFFDLDYQMGRMAGLQIVNNDTLVVARKGISTKIGERKVKGNISFDVWVKKNEKWELIKSNGQTDYTSIVFEQTLIDSQNCFYIKIKCKDENSTSQICIQYYKILSLPHLISYE